MRSKKKILSLFLSLCLVLSIIGPMQVVKAAQGGVYLSVNKTSVAPGDYVSVTVNFPGISNDLNNKAALGTIVVSYDKDRFSFEKSGSTIGVIKTLKDDTSGPLEANIDATTSDNQVKVEFKAADSENILDLKSGYSMTLAFKAKTVSQAANGVFSLDTTSGFDKVVESGKEALYDVSGSAISQTVTVKNKNNQNIKSSVNSLSLTYGDIGRRVTGYTDANGATISYTVISGSDVISVNRTTGEITTLKRGTATLRIESSETFDYKSAYIDVGIEVKAKPVAITSMVVPSTVKYTGSALTPPLFVTTNTTPSYELKPGVDYTVNYYNNVNLGTATATVYPMSSSNFDFSAQTTYFNITNLVIPELTVNAYTTTYTGSKVTPESIAKTARYNGVNLLGTWAWKNNISPVNAGTGNFILTFTPSDSLYASSDVIVPVTINKATISGKPSITDIYSANKSLRYDVTITAPATWPAGTFKWVDRYGNELNNTELSNPIIKGLEYYWVYTITNEIQKNNYNPISGKAIIWEKDTPDPIIPINGDSKNTVKLVVANNNAAIGELTQDIVNAATGNSNTKISFDISGQTKVTSATFTKTSFETVQAAVNSTANKVKAVEVVFEGGAVSFDGAALKAIADAATGDSISVSVASVAQTSLASAQQLAINNFVTNTATAISKTSAVMSITATVTSGGKNITSFGNGKETISMKHKLLAGQDGKYLHVYHVSADGKMTLQETLYDNGMVTFVTNHNSDYVVIYDEQTVNSSLRTVRRVFSLKTGEHLMTSDDNEVKSLLLKGYWIEDAPMGKAGYEGKAVYRLFNIKSGEHLYTADLNECRHLTAGKNWIYDNGAKPVFYGFESGTAVYRLRNMKLPGVSAHINTSDLNEISVLLTRGYEYDNDAKPVFYLK